MKLILTILVLLALAVGGMVALSHHDVIRRSDLTYSNFQHSGIRSLEFT